MRFDSLVFDLDGTLWDTTPACAVAWNQVLADHGIDRTVTAEDVQRVTGKPHDECLRVTLPDLEESTLGSIIDATATADNEAIERLGGALYPGVAEGLNTLAATRPLFIVSNCQCGYIETFLRLSGLGALITDFECFGNTRRPKGDNLAAVIARNNLQNPVMIGDAEGDEAAARQCGIPYAFVTYGFGRPVNPDYTFDSFADLVQSI